MGQNPLSKLFKKDPVIMTIEIIIGGYVVGAVAMFLITMQMIEYKPEPPSGNRVLARVLFWPFFFLLELVHGVIEECKYGGEND